VTSNVKSHDRDALPMMIMKVSKYFWFACISLKICGFTH
jgi:hypothetical protein